MSDQQTTRWREWCNRKPGDPSPYDHERVEIGWKLYGRIKPCGTVAVAKLAPEWNVANIWWRPAT